MGLSVSTAITYLQTGVDNQEEMKKYQELKKEAQEKLGNKFTAEHDRICAILAKDSKATVDDVETMYNSVKQNGIWGSNGTNNEQKLRAFQFALKSIPSYKNAKLSAENLNELLGIYNSSFIAQISGKTQQETFKTMAEDYIKKLNKPQISRDTKDNLIANQNTETIFSGAEQTARLNQLNIRLPRR